MSIKNVIVIWNDGNFETWGSLTGLCKAHPDFSYHYIKKMKYPFKYKGWSFKRCPYNERFPKPKA